MQSCFLGAVRAILRRADSDPADSLPIPDGLREWSVAIGRTGKQCFSENASTQTGFADH